MNERALRRLLKGAIDRLLGAFALVGLSSCLLGASNPVEHGNVAFDISPDGEQVVFAAADGDLYLLQLTTSRVSQLTKTPRAEYCPAFSPDGSAIIYAADTEGRNGSCLFVFSLASKQPRQLTGDPVTKDVMPSYSPDGSQIVFARAQRYRRYSLGGWTWDDWDLFLMNSDGSGVKRTTQNKYYGLSSPKFLPDGSNIVYSAEANRAQSELTTTLFVVDAMGKQPPRLATKAHSSRAKGGAWASGPDVFTNGTIAFVSDRVEPFQYDVFIMEPGGGAPKPLGVTTISRYNRFPTFLPGGRSLLFLAGREWNESSRPIFSLWMVNTEGSNRHCIAESTLFTDPLRWKPNR
jgi:Tol biopolymer transport system component